MPKQRANGKKPQRRDPVATRSKLLTAARREFARNGLAGARVDEIADRAIRKLIESSFDHLALHPDFIVLLNDENRNGARHVRASLRIGDMHSPLVSMVSKILKQGVREGAFRRGINPVHLYISIAGLSYFFFSNTPTLSAIFGKDLSSAAARRARRKHVVDLVLQALRP